MRFRQSGYIIAPNHIIATCTVEQLKFKDPWLSPPTLADGFGFSLILLLSQNKSGKKDCYGQLLAISEGHNLLA